MKALSLAILVAALMSLSNAQGDGVSPSGDGCGPPPGGGPPPDGSTPPPGCGPPPGGPSGGGPPGGGGGGGGGGPMFEACTCTEDADYTLARYEETLTNNTRTIRTMGIPNHPYHKDRAVANPNPVCLHPSVVSLPVEPMRNGNFTATSLGVTGILKTGGFVYNHLKNFHGVDDVAKVHEAESLDSCFGHADPTCSYHYHEISKLAECTHDNQWDECELIGYLFDGFPIYSHCFLESKSRFLTSCFAITTDADNDGGGDTSDYQHVPTDDCDLDMANGYDFTGKGILDNNGNAISGYGYVASDSYPYVMAYYAGTTWASMDEFETWPGSSEDTYQDLTTASAAAGSLSSQWHSILAVLLLVSRALY